MRHRRCYLVAFVLTVGGCTSQTDSSKGPNNQAAPAVGEKVTAGTPEPGMDKKPAAKPTVAEIRAKYEKYPCKVLGIIEPVEIKEVGYFKDGGSILWLLVDAKEKKYSLRTHQSPSAPFYYTNPPNDQGRFLDRGGEEEKELYGVWLRWMKKNIPNAEGFLAGKDPLPKTTFDAAGLALSFGALERRIVVGVEKVDYPN